MEKKKLHLQWTGVMIELCLARITPDQKALIETLCPDLDKDARAQWYDNTPLLKDRFKVDNWWSLDDLDRAMGLVFADRAELDKRLAHLAFAIDGSPKTVDPEALQLSFYAPEAIAPLGPGEQVLCHGVRREALLQLHTEFEPPFDPSLTTLSFIRYPQYGYILIDLDYDGHDDVQFSFGKTTYLKPRFLGKEAIDVTADPTEG